MHDRKMRFRSGGTLLKPRPGDTMIVASDQHHAAADSPEGGVDPAAWSCFLQAISVVKPDIYVNIGDVGEFNSASHWQWKRRKRPPIEYQLERVREDAQAARMGLLTDFAQLPDGCKKVVFQGNHDIWCDYLVEENPHLAGDKYAPGGDGWMSESLLKVDKKMLWVPYGQIVKIGQLAMYHGGHWSTKYHTQRHLAELGCSVMYGHTHDATVAKQSNLGGYHGAWSIGCLCKLDKDFLRGRPTNWSHAFAIVHFEKGGAFHVEIVDIYDGVCYVQGTRIQG